ncbi:MULTISPECIES: 3-hydroxybutyrate dehydrogenase [Bordetella]|uniref:3-hydroxybutyrate dehydrogenase n=1 Tax=Bordetella genomosp. 2 TaxID=1983456 RepID=A0A261VQP2_9BORD|nr:MULTISPECIES: 3-hydroxybutyrate dehydrogenase [Bordetella]OZI76438.1 3-hydroxybutyrate dehydrogenase [Bordetella genomosp. 2]
MALLKGRVALVTGSTSGIGLALARRLADAGAHLVLNGLASAAEAEALCDHFAQQHGDRPEFAPCDLRDYRQIEQMIAGLNRRHGALDILVNNAGIQHVSPIAEFSPQIWQDMLAVNLSASFHTIRTALPAMRERGWGRIINMASISGLRGRAGKAGYNATKHGLIGLTKSVALETAPTAITCNAICPGWVHTPLVQKQIDALATREGLDNDAATQRLIGLRQPSGRFVTVEQIAELAVFFCSPAAAEVRGVAWAMDGGTTAQ